jgi:hypothetical protein
VISPVPFTVPFMVPFMVPLCVALVASRLRNGSVPVERKRLDSSLHATRA